MFSAFKFLNQVFQVKLYKFENWRILFGESASAMSHIHVWAYYVT